MWCGKIGQKKVMLQCKRKISTANTCRSMDDEFATNLALYVCATWAENGRNLDGLKKSYLILQSINSQSSFCILKSTYT